MADEITDPAREMADLIDFLVGLNAVTPHGHQAPQSWQVLSNGLHIEPTSAEFLELLAAIRSRLARLHEFVSKLDNPTVTHDVKQHIYQAVARFAQTFNPTNFTIQWPQILTSCVVAADATTFRMFSPVMVQYQPLKRLADGDREEALNGVRQAIVIPRSAVVMRGSLACAYVIDSQGIAQLRSLTLGATEGALVEVLSGISAGERLVDAPSDRDFAGKRIEAQP